MEDDREKFWREDDLDNFNIDSSAPQVHAIPIVQAAPVVHPAIHQTPLVHAAPEYHAPVLHADPTYYASVVHAAQGCTFFILAGNQYLLTKKWLRDCFLQSSP